MDQVGGLPESYALSHLARLIGVHRDHLQDWRDGASISARYAVRFWILFVLHDDWMIFPPVLPEGVSRYRRYPWLSIFDIDWASGKLYARRPKSSGEEPPKKPARPGTRDTRGPFIQSDLIPPDIFEFMQPKDRHFRNKAAIVRERCLSPAATKYVFHLAGERYCVIHEMGDREGQVVEAAAPPPSS